jgi:hypothetical protein
MDTHNTSISDGTNTVKTSGLDRSTDDAGATRNRAERRNASYGYRVGTARAQGPDPYTRFDGDPEPASNARQFPTRDREPGDKLKLSGLLGPNTGDDRVQTSAESKSADKSSRNVGKNTGENSDLHSQSERSSDESE